MIKNKDHVRIILVKAEANASRRMENSIAGELPVFGIFQYILLIDFALLFFNLDAMLGGKVPAVKDE